MAEVKTNIFQRALVALGLGKKQTEPHARDYRFTSLVYSTPYTGEKNLGEAGPIKSWNPQYEILRQRAWDSYLTSEVVQIIINKFSTWVIGKGLKLHAEPNKVLLESEGINLDRDKFSELVESRFETYANSDMCDYAGMKSLGMLEKTAYKNVKIGGDCLVVLRVINGIVKIQLIDGCHVRSPLGYGTEYFPRELENGNRIMNGVEMNETGQHVAYYVWTDEPNNRLQYERIPCRGAKTKIKMAFLISGLEYRIHNVRSIPAISTTLETLAKVDRYKEATLATAEEQAKISYTIEHEMHSDGNNPMLKNIVKARDVGASGGLPVTDDGQVVADKIAVTTNKQAWNMPIGAKLKMHTPSGQNIFKDFYSANFDTICAAFGAPPEVMASKYDSTFSSARAAIKDWEHTLNVERAEFAFQFNKPIYDLWLEVEILKGKIAAPGYLLARVNNDMMLIEAYRKSRFVGANVPHIDPLKEVNAERAKLGKGAEFIPLTTVQQATENLNGGDSDANIEQFEQELKDSTKRGIVKEEQPAKTEPPKES